MKFIKCSHCGKIIPVNTFAYNLANSRNVFCSKECFTDEYADHIKLTEKKLTEIGIEPTNDKVVMSRKMEIHNEIESLKKELEELEKIVPEEKHEAI